MIKLLLCLFSQIYAELNWLNDGPLIADNEIRNIEEDLYEVQTENGPVRGFLLGNTGILQYLDIPYGRFDASKPFQKPEKPQAWNTMLKNKEHVSRCPQMAQNDVYIGKDDCLTLSVFTRILARNMDVLFHIHDGDLTSGSGNPEIYKPEQLVREGLVLVLPNYRLGSLGFMCWQNETVPGNAGLKDLALALEWVKNNIEVFGGNSSNIVVSGIGSGGALVDYLLVLNQTSRYISKAITESGFALSHWALNREPLQANVEINLNGDLEAIVRASKNFTFKPCIEDGEDAFVTASIWKLLRTQKIDKPLMIGYANQAGMVHVLNLDNEAICRINTDLSLLLPTDLVFKGNQRSVIGQRVKKQYFGESNITRNEMEKLSLCFTDFAYLSPGIRQARLLNAAGGTVYFYEFSYSKEGQHLIPGASRGDSLRYIFKNVTEADDESGENNEHEQQTLTKNPIKTLWINFIKTGIPTVSNVKWDTFGSKAGKAQCLIIGSKITLTDNLHVERLKFWDEIYDRYFIETNRSSAMKLSIFMVYINAMITLNLLLSTV